MYVSIKEIYMFLQAIEERDKCKCPTLPHLDPRNRVEHFRKIADNVMMHRAARSNLNRVSPKKPTVPTYKPAPQPLPVSQPVQGS